MSVSMTSGFHNPLVQGFLLCASILVAIGPQNLVILRQGLRRQYLFAIAMFSALTDMVLIALGAGGLGTLISTSSALLTVVTTGSVLFLIWCGVRSLYNAYRPQALTNHAVSSMHSTSLLTTIVVTLGFSLLNPGAYLDTLVISGSKSTFVSIDERLIFGIGTVVASMVWFFALSFSTSKSTPIIQSQAAWRALDLISGCIMLGLAATMLVAPYLP